MTKVEIRALASDVELMDFLNTLSGLLEVNKNEDNGLIGSLICDIYSKMKSKDTKTTSLYNKAYLLDEIKKRDPSLWKQLQGKRYMDIRFWYNKLTKDN